MGIGSVVSPESCLSYRPKLAASLSFSGQSRTILYIYILVIWHIYSLVVRQLNCAFKTGSKSYDLKDWSKCHGLQLGRKFANQWTIRSCTFFTFAIKKTTENSYQSQFTDFLFWPHTTQKLNSTRLNITFFSTISTLCSLRGAGQRSALGYVGLSSEFESRLWP